MEKSAAPPVMTETRQMAWAEGRSDQPWMGTIQEAVTCGRLITDNRRQETGSAPHRNAQGSATILLAAIPFSS